MLQLIHWLFIAQSEKFYGTFCLAFMLLNLSSVSILLLVNFGACRKMWFKHVLEIFHLFRMCEKELFLIFCHIKPLRQL